MRRVARRPRIASACAGKDCELGTLWLSSKTVESHIRSAFAKLGLREAPEDNRRVLAVLAYLRR